VNVSRAAGCSFGHVEEHRNGGEWDFLRLVVQDMRGDHRLLGGVILSDEAGMLKELQEIEAILLQDAKESSFMDCHQWPSAHFGRGNS
jgi:hypothetical protein